ncbi:MAG: hypothetical protein DRP08_07230 [Candidatus Aenigmatarchaeota archaeon]|nr:MAG: hypothetical protein DRP08_07230 [Candidatus Aenigmarchaeota archaeon]
MATRTDDPANEHGHGGGGVTSAEWDANGFDDATKSTIAFTDLTRTFEIAPTVTSFDYFVKGEKYTSTGNTLAIADVEGVHVLYYEDGTGLKDAINPTPSQVVDVIMEKAIVCILYWSVSLQEGIYVGEERHGKVMSPATHNYLHWTAGLVYNFGLGMNTIDANQSGNVNAHAQFGIDAGAVADEDIYEAITAVTSTTGLPIYYMEGSSAAWKRHVNAGYSVMLVNAGGTIVPNGTASARLPYNLNTAGTWTTPIVTNNDFVLLHVFATTEKDKPMIAIMGQAMYANRNLAREGADTEIYALVTSDVLFPEIKPIATFIFQTSDGDTNDVHCCIRSVDGGGDYVDWRSSTIDRTTVSTNDHNSLNNMVIAGAGVPYGHIDDDAQSIAGIKTFSDGVVVPLNNATDSVTLSSTAEDNTTLANTGLAYGSGKIRLYMGSGVNDVTETFEVYIYGDKDNKTKGAISTKRVGLFNLAKSNVTAAGGATSATVPLNSTTGFYVNQIVRIESGTDIYAVVTGIVPGTSITLDDTYTFANDAEVQGVKEIEFNSFNEDVTGIACPGWTSGNNRTVYQIIKQHN